MVSAAEPDCLCNRLHKSTRSGEANTENMGRRKGSEIPDCAAVGPSGAIPRNADGSDYRCRISGLATRLLVSPSHPAARPAQHRGVFQRQLHRTTRADYHQQPPVGNCQLAQLAVFLQQGRARAILPRRQPRRLPYVRPI